jgi:hypothetical protein
MCAVHIHSTTLICMHGVGCNHPQDDERDQGREHPVPGADGNPEVGAWGWGVDKGAPEASEDCTHKSGKDIDADDGHSFEVVQQAAVLHITGREGEAKICAQPCDMSTKTQPRSMQMEVGAAQVTVPLFPQMQWTCSSEV